MSYHDINKMNQYSTDTSKIGTKLIKQVNIDTSRMIATVNSRSIQVVGDSDAIFSLQVSRSSDGRFYDFVTNVFEATTTSQSRLKNQSPGSTIIAFPAASGGDTYTIHIFAEPHFNTMLDFGSNRLYYSTTINQVASAEITFTTDVLAPGSATAIGTSTGSLIDSFTTAGRPTVVMNDLQITVAAAIVDYEFFIDDTVTDADLNNGTWNSSALYWETGNYVANGAGTGATSLILTSVDDLYVGMQLSYVNSVFQTVLRAITAIDTDTLTVTLDGVETWSDTHVIKFRAYGTNLIKKAIGIGLALSNPTCKLGQTTTTFRTEATSTITAGADIAVNGTGGIGKGATIRMRGIDKSSSASACTVATVTGSVAAGSLTVANGEIEASSARPVRAKTKIYIDGSSNKIYLSGTIHISKYPSADQNIYVDLSKIFTIGVNS